MVRRRGIGTSGGQEVHIGRDGWLFLTGGNNPVMDRYRCALFQWRVLHGWIRLIEKRAARARELGIRYLHVVVPEKLSVYDNMTDSLSYDPRKASTRRLARQLARNSAYLDLLAPLRGRRNRSTPLYLRTDTHWTLEGCLVAYREIMRALGAQPPIDIAARPRIRSVQVMDLGDKLSSRPREEVERITLLRDSTRVAVGPLQARYEMAGRDQQLHVGAHVVYHNSREDIDQRCLIIFGDSCAHFDPFMLTGMFAESFREVHFVWSSSLDWKYIEKIKPDIILFEIAERFLARLPADDFDVEVAGRRGTAGRISRASWD